MALWTPEQLALTLWMDGTDDQYFTVDGSNRVEQWDDRSGNDNNMTQPNSARRPAYISGTGINCDSKTDFRYLLCDTAHPIRSVVWVLKATDGTGDYRHVDFGWHGSTAASGYLFHASYTGATIRDGNHWVDGTATAALSVPRPTAKRMILCQTTADMSVDDTGWGNDSFPNRSWYGNKFEIITSTEVWDTETRQKIEGYLAHKHDIADQLSSDHPYKSAPPTYSPGGTEISIWLDQPYKMVDEFMVWLEQNYSLPALLTANLIQPYSFLLQAWLSQFYGDVPLLQAFLIQRYGDARLLEAWLLQKYGDPVQLEIWLDQPYDYPDLLSVVLEQRYGIATEAFETFLAQFYNMFELPQLVAILNQPYLLQADKLTYDFDYSLTIGGIDVAPPTVTWDFRRSRYYGTISMVFKKQEQALLCEDGAEVVFSVGGTTYYFFIEGGWREISSSNSLRYEASAHSHTKLLGAPHSDPMFGQVAGGMVSEIIARLAAEKGIDVVYRINDEYLDGADLYANGETPIEFIRKIINNAKAVMQAGPDGRTLYIDWDDEVSMTDWDSTTPEATITDLMDFFSTSESSDPQSGYNRFLITGQESATGDRGVVEIVIDARTKEVRRYLSVTEYDLRFELDHSGGSWVGVEPFGVVSGQRTETVEFVSGAGRAGLPIESSISEQWLRADLGFVTPFSDGRLESEVDGNSLLDITYGTRYWKWIVRSDNIEDVQVWARPLEAETV